MNKLKSTIQFENLHLFFLNFKNRIFLFRISDCFEWPINFKCIQASINLFFLK